MKTKILYILIISSIIIAPFKSYSQDKQNNEFLNNSYLQLGLGTTTNFKSLSSGLSNNYIECSAGYFVIPKLYAYARFEGGYKLSEVAGTNIFNRYQNLGAGLGWRFYKSEDDGSFDWKTDYSLSVGNNDWKNNEFGTSVIWKLPSCRIVGISFALGYKYYHSRTTGIKSAGGVSASIGFSF